MIFGADLLDKVHNQKQVLMNSYKIALLNNMEKSGVAEFEDIKSIVEQV